LNQLPNGRLHQRLDLHLGDPSDRTKQNATRD
jgi:hypothetical protein